MKKILPAIIIFLFLIVSVACQKNNPVIEIQTPKGKIAVELDLKHAPVTATHFLRLVEEGVYDGAQFYRTVRGPNENNKIPISVVQGGIYHNQNRPEIEPIAHETTEQTGLSHTTGVISMARRDPGTASTEFFICIGNNVELDFGGRRNPDGQGFAAFGHVIEGMNTLHAIWGSPAIGEQLDPYIRIHKIKVR